MGLGHRRESAEGGGLTLAPNPCRRVIAPLHRIAVKRQAVAIAASLKKHGVLSAGLPSVLGGSADHRELGEMLRVLARYCGSTAHAT